MATRDTLLDLVALGYEAALEPSLWPHVAADASRAFDAPHIMLGVADRRGNELMRAATQRVSGANLAGYMTPEINPGVAFSASTPRPRSSGATQGFPTPILSVHCSTKPSCGRSICGTWRS
jgi:hypothetical protein